MAEDWVAISRILVPAATPVSNVVIVPVPSMAVLAALSDATPMRGAEMKAGLADMVQTKREAR